MAQRLHTLTNTSNTIILNFTQKTNNMGAGTCNAVKHEYLYNETQLNSKKKLKMYAELEKLIMVALCSRADHYIFILFLLLFFLSSFFFLA